MSRSSDEGSEFLKRQNVALAFASVSRKEIATRVVACLSEVLECAPHVIDEIDTVHNYVSLETCRDQQVVVHRKGACRASAGEFGIIPGSMGVGSYLVEGRGSAWSYNSSSHGAGRTMSRSDAFRKLHTRSLFKDMEGIIWAESDRLKDESPRAYKDIRAVLKAQRDLVRVCAHLRPLVVVKGED